MSWPRERVISVLKNMLEPERIVAAAIKFKFKGILSVWKKGGGVGAVQDMGISIAPSTVIELDESKG